MSALKLWRNQKIHFIGIKGVGMSGLAQLLKKEGAVISGSDTNEEFPSEENLKEAGIVPRLFSDLNIKAGIDLVIYSSAYDREHPERKKAAELKISQVSYAEALGEFSKVKKTIVVTGTHGKTTTAAVLGTIFQAAALDPTALVGERITNWKNSVLSGQGEYFIVEGDEYQEKFRLLKPVAVLIPSLDYDHVDYFKNQEEYLEAFHKYIKENPTAKLITTPEVGRKLGVAAIPYEKEDEEIFKKSRFILPGEAYRSNCLLAIRTARLFGISRDKILKGLANFKGAGRRMTLYSEPASKITVIYDYAHHPVEIKATLKALRDKYAGREIIVVFQPHTYSRTATFLEEFASSFSIARVVFFDKIYSSAREKKGGVSDKDLLRETQKKHSDARSYRPDNPGEFLNLLHKFKTPLVIFMGAGDIWKEARKISKLLSYGQVS